MADESTKGSLYSDSGRSRSKCTASCVPCQRSKRRCDGERPCRRCVDRKGTVNCVYVTQRARGARKATKLICAAAQLGANVIAAASNFNDVDLNVSPTSTLQSVAVSSDTVGIPFNGGLSSASSSEITSRSSVMHDSSTISSFFDAPMDTLLITNEKNISDNAQSKQAPCEASMKYHRSSPCTVSTMSQNASDLGLSQENVAILLDIPLDSLNAAGSCVPGMSCFVNCAQDNMRRAEYTENQALCPAFFVCCENIASPCDMREQDHHHGTSTHVALCTQSPFEFLANDDVMELTNCLSQPHKEGTAISNRKEPSNHAGHLTAAQMKQVWDRMGDIGVFKRVRVQCYDFSSVTEVREASSVDCALASMAAQNPVLSWDCDGKIRSCNVSMATLLGYRDPASLSLCCSNIFDLMHGMDQRALAVVLHIGSLMESFKVHFFEAVLTLQHALGFQIRTRWKVRITRNIADHYTESVAYLYAQ